MGQALTTSKGAGNSKEAGKALVKVYGTAGKEIICRGSDKIYSNIIEKNGIAEFRLDYGTWYFKYNASYPVDEYELIITSMKVYEIFKDQLDKNVTFGIQIDMSNSDPESAVTYIDDAVNFTPLAVDLDTGICNYGSWEDIITEVFGCRPCLFEMPYLDMGSTQQEKRYLNPNDYTKFEDGTDADIESGSNGDVMVEFKKTWYKYSIDGDILTFQVANYDRSSDGFVTTAFKDSNSVVKGTLYYGAYEGYVDDDDKLRSLSGKYGTDNSIPITDLSSSRYWANNNGDLYGIEDWCKRCYILGLLMLITKTRNLQAALGSGKVSDSLDNKIISTGSLNKCGLFAGYRATETKGVKTFGIENLWGNCFSWCDGIITLSSSTIGFKEHAPYNDTGEDYVEAYDGYNRDSDLCISKMNVILNGAAIFPSAGQSDPNIGWVDYAYIHSESRFSLVACVGGCTSLDEKLSGPFMMRINLDPITLENYAVGRLICLSTITF